MKENFVRLTAAKSGKEVFVNPNKVSHFSYDEAVRATTLYIDGHPVMVKEQPQTIIELFGCVL